MEIMYNEKTGKFEPAKKPYKTVEIRYETEEDYNNFALKLREIGGTI